MRGIWLSHDHNPGTVRLSTFVELPAVRHVAIITFVRRVLLSALVVGALCGGALVGRSASPPPAVAASCPPNTYLDTSERPTTNPDGTPVQPFALPWGLLGQMYTATIQVSGGTPPYQWLETGKSLPPGVNYSLASSSGTLNDEAVVSGTPSQSWKAGLQFAITDQDGCTTQFGTEERWDWYFGHPPQNNTPPFIDGGSGGMANVGDQITCVNGTWNEDPNSSPTREFGWFRNGVKPPFFTSDQGAYTVQADDQGKTLTCGVSETNMFGSAEADSNNSVTVPQGSADLTIAKSVDQQHAVVGENVTYTITVFNHGPNAAANAGVIDSLPSGVRFVSASPSSGTCANNSGTVDCSLGDLPSGTGASVTLVVAPTAAGSLTNRASVASDTPDPNTSNNIDGVTIAVTAGGGGSAGGGNAGGGIGPGLASGQVLGPPLGVILQPDLQVNKVIIDDTGKPIHPTTVPLGAEVRYAITVKNVGDAAAEQVFLRDGALTQTVAGLGVNRLRTVRTLPVGLLTVSSPDGLALGPGVAQTRESGSFVLLPDRQVTFTAEIRALDANTELDNGAYVFNEGKLAAIHGVSVEIAARAASPVVLSAPSATVPSGGTSTTPAQCQDRAGCQVETEIDPPALPPGELNTPPPPSGPVMGLHESFPPALAIAARTRPIGTVTGRIRGGHSGRLRVKLNRAGLALLRKSRTMTVPIRGTIRSGGKRHKLDTELVLIRR